MNDRHNDPLDQSIRSALGDIVSESPTPGDLPVRSLELRRAEPARSRRPMLVAAAVVLIAGVAGTVAIANRSTPSNTVTLDPAEAAEDLADAQALLDEGITVDSGLITEITRVADTAVVGTVPSPPSAGDASVDPVAPPATLVPPDRPAPDDTTPVTVILSNYSVFNVSVRRQVQAGETLLIEWSVEDPNGIEQTNARVGGASGWVSWCEFPMMGSRISGNERLGRYRAGCSVPANAPNGEYTVFFQASSLVGAPSEPLGTSQVTFEVVNGSDDNSPPTISDLSVPSTASAGDAITITWRAVDPSGVDYSYAWLSNGGFALPDGERLVEYDRVWRISGDQFDGVYSLTIRFIERSPLGTYSIWFGRRDGVGNQSIDQVSGTIVLGA